VEVRVVPGEDAPIGTKVRVTLGSGPFHILRD
jgi:hypothetical protein